MSTRAVLAAALILCAAASRSATAGTWSDLWSTHDQQGQQLLETNHPGEAAQVFSDPKRRAYAQLQAGQYAKAADLLAPLKDADSQYNRGNALAHAGKLDEALKSYDAALATSPGNQDALRNRNLVAKALESQKQQSQQGQDGGTDKGQQGKPKDDGQGSSGAGDKQSGDKNPDGKSGQNGGQNQAGQQGQSAQQGQAGQPNQANQPNQPGQQGQAGQSQSAQAQSGNQAGNPQSASAQNPPGQQPSGASPAQSAGAQQNQADTAQQDAQAALQSARANSKRAQNPQQAASAAPPGQTGQQSQPDPRGAAALRQGQMSGTGTQQGPADMSESPLVKGGTAVDAQKAPPRSEQALALDQWLRGIPEDSSELLRRKFLIEHMLKQQGDGQ